MLSILTWIGKYMEKVLITGVSSGVGRELAKDLSSRGYIVIGVARRKNLLESLRNELPNPANFTFIRADLANEKAWEGIITTLKKEKYIPDVVIFNAATWGKKLVTGFSYEDLEEIHKVNFLSVMKGLSLLFLYCQKRKTHFIAISTLSALWGSPEEGVGYPASKAALSIAFEGLYQKFKNTNFTFTTISFGPIKANTNSFKLFRPLQISLEDTVSLIEKAIREKKVAYFAPSLLFFCFSLLRLLPSSLKLPILSFINSLHPYRLHKTK